jgi:hypothetical protein
MNLSSAGGGKVLDSVEALATTGFDRRITGAAESKNKSQFLRSEANAASALDQNPPKA